MSTVTSSINKLSVDIPAQATTSTTVQNYNLTFLALQHGQCTMCGQMNILVWAIFTIYKTSEDEAVVKWRIEYDRAINKNIVPIIPSSTMVFILISTISFAQLVGFRPAYKGNTYLCCHCHTCYDWRWTKDPSISSITGSSDRSTTSQLAFEDQWSHLKGLQTLMRPLSQPMPLGTQTILYLMMGPPML